MASFDVIFLGGGPAGYVGAIRSAQLGLTVAVIEREGLGGTCVLWGCIPAKALLEASSIANRVKHAAEFGVMVGEVKTDFGVAMKRSRDISTKNSKGVEFLFKKNKITWIKGTGLLGPNKSVKVTTADGKSETHTATKGVVIGTGSRVKGLPQAGLELNNTTVISSDEALVRRFESSRRPHPLQGAHRIVDGLRAERELLGDLRANADVVIDTSTLNVHDLRRKVEAAFADGDPAALHATVMSFGFKYGVPVDADMVIDVRFLPNPHWNPELRPLTGLDPAVSSAVLTAPPAIEFLDLVTAQVGLVTPGYLDEGKRYLTIAVGCTGGKHRSVAMAQELARLLGGTGMEALVMHRDLGRE